MEVLGDRYELGRPIGTGGMAHVVEARDRLLERKVAVKRLAAFIADDPEVRRRFLREGRTAARFSHPSAVEIYDSGEDDEQPWIVMELVEGEDLAQRLDRTGALPEPDALAIADEVLAALAAAHATGIVHRDVKPDNVLLPGDGGVKLTDFGIARTVQETTGTLTATGTILGTAKYLSPEQVTGETATPASDVYAMGVVLFEMLAGVPPFDGDSPITVALAHSRRQVPDIRQVRDDLSPAVLDVLDRALAKDPADRFATAEQMRAALREARGLPPAAAATVPLETPPAAAAPQSPQRRRRLVLAGAGLVAALALAALSGVGPDDAEEAVADPPASQEGEASGGAGATREDDGADPAAASDGDGGAKAKDEDKTKDKDKDKDKNKNKNKGKGKAKGKGKGKGK